MLPKTDLHVHSQFSPCAEDVTIEKNAEKALRKGVEILAITDHGVVKRPPWLAQYFQELEKVRKKYEGKIVILSGMEVDILDDGQPAVAADILSNLDIVVGSVHRVDPSRPLECWYRKVKKALESGWLHVLGHPTDAGWRKISPPVEQTLELLDIAKSQGIAVEMNSHHKNPQPDFLKLAVKTRVKITPNSDAHNLREVADHTWHIKALRRAKIDPGEVNWLREKDIQKLL